MSARDNIKPQLWPAVFHTTILQIKDYRLAECIWDQYLSLFPCFQLFPEVNGRAEKRKGVQIVSDTALRFFFKKKKNDHVTIHSLSQVTQFFFFIH